MNVFHAEAVLLAHTAGRLLRMARAGDRALDDIEGWGPVGRELAAHEEMCADGLWVRVTLRPDGETWATLLIGHGEQATRLAILTGRSFVYGVERLSQRPVLGRVVSKRFPQQLKWLRKWVQLPRAAECRFEIPIDVAWRAAEYTVRLAEISSTAVPDEVRWVLAPYGVGEPFRSEIDDQGVSFQWNNEVDRRLRIDIGGASASDDVETWWPLAKNGSGEWDAEPSGTY